LKVTTAQFRLNQGFINEKKKAFYELLKTIVAEELQVDDAVITDAATIEALGLDSLTFAEVIISLERKLGRSIDTTEFVEEIQNDTTFGELASLLDSAAQA
jgi:acyl carrier protein